METQLASASELLRSGGLLPLSRSRLCSSISIRNCLFLIKMSIEFSFLPTIFPTRSSSLLRFLSMDATSLWWFTEKRRQPNTPNSPPFLLFAPKSESAFSCRLLLASGYLSVHSFNVGSRKALRGTLCRERNSDRDVSGFRKML